MAWRKLPLIGGCWQCCRVLCGEVGKLVEACGQACNSVPGNSDFADLSHQFWPTLEDVVCQVADPV